jgi:DNA polymerase I
MVTKESKNGREIFVAIDANSIVHRAFHSYPPALETTGGVQVNAVFGFTVMFLKVLELFDPKYIVCTFDTPRPTFRHAKYTPYKGTRKPTDQSLIDQFPIVEDVVRSFNVPILKKEGYEADDILGTLAEYVHDGKWCGSNVQLCIVTGDTDLLQLVQEKVSVILPQGNFRNLKEFMREDVYEKLGVYPEQVVDYKSIMGDASDNIPGIKGVGAKTAASLLNEYGTIDNIYANLDSLKPRMRKLFEEGVEQASISKELVSIVKDVDIVIDLESCLEKDFDVSEVKEKFMELEFRTLINKIPESIGSQKKEINFSTEQFDLFDEISKEDAPCREIDEDALKEALKAPKGIIGIFVPEREIVSKEKWIMLGVVDKKGEVLEASLTAKEGEGVVSQALREKGGCETLVAGFEDFVSEFPSLPPVDSPYDIKLLAHVENSGLRDYSLSNLAFTYLGRHLSEKLDPNECKKPFDFVKEIFEKLQKELEERDIKEGLLDSKVDFLEFTSKTENSLSYVLADMERRGVLIDKKLLDSLHDDLERDVEKIVKKIYYDVGHEFNINSSKQLSDVLFNELDLPPVSKTKTSFSTREDVLKQLEGAHPVVSKILEYRQKTKIMSNYVHVYKVELEKREKEGEELSIHTDFKQTGTTSGRLSSVNPNMQNLPLGNELSERLREIFIPREGFVFLSADYSQIDLRIMAHLSEDEILIKDFEQKKDIHMTTASRILDKGEEDISSTERRIGKTINFGIIYGLTSFGLSQSLSIPVSDAEKYIKEYFENYSGVAEYINNMTKEVQNTRYVETILGRRRYVTGVNSRNQRVQRAAIREAINMPVQGGSADVMKLAMVEIHKLIKKKYEEKAFMVLQIHDEIIFEIKEDVLEGFQKEVKDIMENVINLKVPLGVNFSVGKNMAELK